MKRTACFRPHSITCENRTDGTMLLRSAYPLGDYAEKTGEWLHHWAVQAPERVFMAERSGAGWRRETYQQALQKVQRIGQALLARGMNAQTPILIMSGNSVDHALLTLAAQYVGVPTAPIAEQYSLITAAQGRLIEAVQLIQPKMAYVSDAEQYGAALALDALEGIDIIASHPGNNAQVTAFDTLLAGDNTVDLQAAYAAVTADTVAKILMTSGSTSAPKGVLTTQRMMCVNQAQMADGLPFLKDHPPKLLDWLPWNHVFGGSHNFNMALAHGGSFYIDDGKPTASAFERSLENLRLAAGTVSFNVPVGYAMLAKALQADQALKQQFFQDLDLIFYAGASLPQDVWQSLEAMAMEIKGEVPLMTSSWGLTETAPAVLLQSEPIDRSGVVGAPLVGTRIKLIPDEDQRCEIRVKGPNIMPGYFRNPEKTAEAFDEEGYFITGDAMVFVDPENLNRGLRFDGRISEDFKLLTGTWVRAAQLRLEALACLAPLAADLVITGADKADIGLMIFPNLEELAKAGYSTAQADGVIQCPKLRAAVTQRLAERAKQASASSTRLTRAIILSEPASLADGEITAKGNLNFRKILGLRAGLLARLYDDTDQDIIKV